MADLWTAKLSEYVDGTLAAADRQALEGHLATCDECRGVLGDLRAIVAGASTLSDTPPANDLWTGIAQRIQPAAPAVLDLGAARQRRRVSFTIPQLAAAGIALMLVSFALANRLNPGGPAAGAQADPGTLAVLHAGTPRSQAVFDQAVAELQAILDAGRGRLDSTTIQMLEANLATIDRAITQAQQAVLADSANAYLRQHLEQTQRRKVALMRRAADLIAVAS